MKRKQSPKTDPNGMAGESARLWADLNAQLLLDDGQRAALLSGLKSLDLADRCRAEITRTGLVQSDRWGQLKPNPLIVAEVSARGLWLRTCSQLGLTLPAPSESPAGMEDES